MGPSPERGGSGLMMQPEKECTMANKTEMDICVDHKIPRQEQDGMVFVGRGVKFERIRRITGYLVGTLDRFNNAKRAEEADRVKHAVMR